MQFKNRKTYIISNKVSDVIVSLCLLHVIKQYNNSMCRLSMYDFTKNKWWTKVSYSLC